MVYACKFFVVYCVPGHFYALWYYGTKNFFQNYHIFHNFLLSTMPLQNHQDVQEVEKKAGTFDSKVLAWEKEDLTFLRHLLASHAVLSWVPVLITEVEFIDVVFIIMLNYVYSPSSFLCLISHLTFLVHNPLQIYSLKFNVVRKERCIFIICICSLG